jgi:hypothetical protein
VARAGGEACGRDGEVLLVGSRGGRDWYLAPGAWLADAGEAGAAPGGAWVLPPVNVSALRACMADALASPGGTARAWEFASLPNGTVVARARGGRVRRWRGNPFGQRARDDDMRLRALGGR